MVSANQRKVARLFVRLGLWKTFEHFRCLNIEPRRGTRWIFYRMRRTQDVDDLHHAPACPANHWHRQRLVFRPCTCGAARAEPVSYWLKIGDAS